MVTSYSQSWFERSRFFCLAQFSPVSWSLKMAYLDLKEFWLPYWTEKITTTSYPHSLQRSGAHNPERSTSMRKCHGFSLTSIFLERFWREFWISLKFHKLVSKTCRPKMIFLPFNYLYPLILVFPFDISYFACAHWHGGDSIFRGKKCPKLCLKINWSSEP